VDLEAVVLTGALAGAAFFFGAAFGMTFS